MTPEDKESVDQETEKRRSARINPTLVLLGNKSVGSIVKVKKRLELPPKGKRRKTNWVYKVGERFRVTGFKKYRNEYSIDTLKVSNKGFTTLPPFFLDKFEPV